MSEKMLIDSIEQSKKARISQSDRDSLRSQIKNSESSLDMQFYQENIERTTTNLREFAEIRQIISIDSIDQSKESQDFSVR